MKKEEIINAYCRIREIDQTIPDDILDFMKEAALEKLQTIQAAETNKNSPNDAEPYRFYWVKTDLCVAPTVAVCKPSDVYEGNLVFKFCNDGSTMDVKSVLWYNLISLPQ